MNEQDAIQSKSQLVDFFRQKEKKKNDWLIGTEHEKFLFSLDDFKPIPYEGENGIEKLLKIKYLWHKQVLKLPVFGDMILKSMLARISLIMGNLSAAGVNLLESLEIAKSVSNNDVITDALENVKKGVFSGDTLTKLFLKEPLFPPTFSQLISVGEQTGQLDEMFNSVASYYEEEFDTTVDNMSSLIEPIMIVFMGVMIGGLMIAMYSPIFNVGALIN